jgi:hypothetical protein
MAESAADRTNRLAEYRFKPGVSANPGGRPKNSSISQRVRSLLARDSDMMDAVQVLDAAGLDVAEWDANGRLSNADLVARAALGIALGRGGDKNVPLDVQLKAIALIWGYTDGRPSDKPVQQLDDDASETQKRITVADFRAAMTAKVVQDAETGPAGGAVAPVERGDVVVVQATSVTETPEPAGEADPGPLPGSDRGTGRVERPPGAFPGAE